MGKFGGMLLRAVSTALISTFVVGSLSGCSENALGSIRPEVNNHMGMIVFPGLFSDSITDLEEDEGVNSGGDGASSGIDGSTDSNDGESGGTVIGDASYFDPLPYNAMSAPDYIKYLDAQIYQHIREILDGLDSSASQSIYFRVFHSGYTTVADDTTAIQQASIYDNKMIGSGTQLYGTVFPEFAYSWLGNATTNPDNNTRIKKARESLLSTINRSNVATTATWVQASAAEAFPYNQSVLQMWGNERLGAETLQDYLNNVRKYVVGTIPNISLKIYRAGGSTTSVTLNNTSDIDGPRYVDHMSKVNADRLFGTYNQYKNRETIKLDLYYIDDYGMLFSYIDGYSKTIVALCCFDGATLDSTLGEAKAQVESIISGTYDYTQWAEISEFVPNATILQSGVRGMN